ncbi:MAG: metal-dependent phosphohydrolase [Planctomycetaceae bacterium]|nr:metal-dependent phosphohydrolase [Planctomycetaceae bacterium]
MPSLREIPEVAALRSGRGVIRIPPETDVPLTPRVRRLIDTAAFRRLASVSQLGLVRLIYPAANHSRQEHSLGVYRTALLFIDRLADDERFAAIVTPADAERFLLAALVHDMGHWPYCHPIEDIGLTDLPTHEQFAVQYLSQPEVSALLAADWDLTPAALVELLDGKPADAAGRVLASMLSGPIDVDKMDYLMRDSLHAGVPYGRNFDQKRLIQSLCLSESGDALAISDKGKTAAEMMVFARYVMFSEVYWHHAVRSATAMLQRAFFLCRDQLDTPGIFHLGDAEMERALLDASAGGPAGELFAGLFGSHRRLYKRVAQWSVLEDRAAYERLARQPFGWLVELSERFAAAASQLVGEPIAPHDILFDAPPMALEVEFDLDVHYAKEGSYRRLGQVSPVVHTLARQQFDDYVKRVRLFAHPRVAGALRDGQRWRAALETALA